MVWKMRLSCNLDFNDKLSFYYSLEYMYSDKIDPTLQGFRHGAFSNEMVHLIMQVYILSIVFHMQRLEKLCIRYLEASVNLENVLVSLTTASTLSLQPIKEYCLRYITKGTLLLQGCSHVFESEGAYIILRAPGQKWGPNHTFTMVQPKSWGGGQAHRAP